MARRRPGPGRARAPSRCTDSGCRLRCRVVDPGPGARYPQAVVHGVDMDDASIALARTNLAGSGVENRVRFDVRDLAAATEEPYDVATMFETLHDLSHHVEVLTAIRASLRPGGALLLADERAAEEFTAPGDPAERLLYGASLMVCLPGSLADAGVDTGAAIRPDTVRRYAEEAGFSCDVVDIEHMLLRFFILQTTPRPIAADV